MSNEDAEKRQEEQTADPVDWQLFRIMSIRPHGFGEERLRIWPKLLHVDHQNLEYEHNHETTTDTSSVWLEILEQPAIEEEVLDGTPHSDERQIELDTDRSFVLYPVDGVSNRDKLQAALNRLIVSLFRRRPHLHYFQGYHDIVSVVFLTLPRELHLPVTEKISLHRLRDSMGTNLDPVVGLLRILQRLLCLVDPKFSATLEHTAPLPYYALSNLLTLFSHDVPTLPLIQHVFDFLLCRPPIVQVYLAAALILTRREEVQLLEDEGEEGMVHSLLTVLPDLYEEGEEPPDQSKVSQTELTESLSERIDTSADVTRTSDPSREPTAAVDKQPYPPATPPSSEEQEGKVQAKRISISRLPDQATAHQDTGVSIQTDEVELTMALEPLPPSEDTVHEAPISSSRSDDSYPISVVPKQFTADPDHIQIGNSADKPPSEATEPTTTIDIKAEPPDDDEAPPSPPVPSVEEAKEEQDEKGREVRTPSPEPLPRPHRPRISISALLTQADELYARYPPTHREIALPSVMGPQSVMLTWSERTADLPDDDEAELMVSHPELIVLPHVEGDADPDPDHDTHGKDRRGKEKEGKEKRRRKLRKPRRITDMVVQRKTMVAGAVLVLGVAMAVYGLNVGLPGVGGGHHRSGVGKELKKFGKLLGGAITGARGKVFDGIRRGLE